MEPVILLVRPFLQLNQGGRVTCVVLTRQIHTFTHTHTHPHERRSQSTVFSCELEVTLALTQAIIALPATIFSCCIICLAQLADGSALSYFSASIQKLHNASAATHCPNLGS